MSFALEPPSDPEALKIIDKFAQYVAKNGPGFEEITRQKQYDNPKFAFLFGGEHSDYYRFRLMVEIQNLATLPLPTTDGGAPIGATEPGTSAVDGVAAASDRATTVAELRKQIEDSENNLKAQKQVLQLQKETKTESLVGERETKQIFSLMRQVGLDVDAIETLIDHMVTSGSKDTIANSKKWIFDNCQTDQLREIVLTYLLYRVRMRTASDSLRLHILYLINDWAHYCQRKKQDNVRQMLSRYVPKLYVYASTSTTLDRSHSEKLDKLIGVWEGYKYFDDNCYKQLRNSGALIATEQAQMSAARQSAAEEVERELDETYRDYERQHVEFERHIRTQIVELEAAIERDKKEIERCEQEQKRQQQQQEAGKRRSRFDQGPPPQCFSLPPPMMAPTNGGPIPSLFANIRPSSSLLIAGVAAAAAAPEEVANVGGPPLAFRTAGDNDLMPTCPYYELPAGMMVPLVAEEDCTFKALDPGQLRIPPPIPPNERLLAEVDRFYAMHITPERPRDVDGWEMNGLADFYRRKTLHRQKVEARMKEDGKSFKDIITNRFVPPTPIGDGRPQESSKRSRKRSRDESSSSRSSSSSSSSSRSSRSRSRSRSKSRSRSRSISRTPPRRFRARSPSPAETRAGFGGAIVAGGDVGGPSSTTFLPSIAGAKAPPPPLNRAQNKGAQLMAKMGWEGRGLGANEQGIEEPINAGEMRDRQDQFRGVGSATDMFDEYRKQMSARTAASYRRHNLD